MQFHQRSQEMLQILFWLRAFTASCCKGEIPNQESFAKGKKKLKNILSLKASWIAIKIAFQHLRTAERFAILFPKEWLQFFAQCSCLIFPILCLRNVSSPQLAGFHLARALASSAQHRPSPPRAHAARPAASSAELRGSLEGNSNPACVLFPAQQPPGVCPPLTPKDERSKVFLHLPPAQLFNLLHVQKGQVQYCARMRGIVIRAVEMGEVPEFVDALRWWGICQST